jgi:carnitine 3-dehydrogenase
MAETAEAHPPRAVGLLGSGVIGGGWAARFLLHGVDVRLYDPDPQAERKVGEILDSARRAYRRLTLAPMPSEGALEVVGSVAEAVDGVDLVQESAPERLELKQRLLAEADAAADPGVILASSTSGLMPTLLARDLHHPHRFLVAHPFNPVYLLPLVELCGGEQTSAEATARADAIYRSVGMRPLRLRKEIDGFVADRLLEALWREALWLVEDEIATVEEIDQAVYLGAGLRWAGMGTFLTYRIAGGEAGMRHFMAQFGPALEWPWSKLTDVPELDAELLDRIVAQSDEQAAGRDVRALERLRDDYLVSVIQALRTHGIGAGEVLAEHERALFARAGARLSTAAVPGDEPLRLVEAEVPAEWIDYNGHAHESRYLQLVGDATDALLGVLGVDAAYLEAGGSYYTVETHLRHLGQARAGDRLTVTTQVLGADAKRLHVFHRLTRGDDEIATAEQMLLHVDTRAGRAAPATDAVRERGTRLVDAHRSLPLPEGVGRRISMPVAPPG